MIFFLMYLLYHAFKLFASLKEVVGSRKSKVDVCRIISQEIITLFSIFYSATSFCAEAFFSAELNKVKRKQLFFCGAEQSEAEANTPSEFDKKKETAKLVTVSTLF